MIVYGLYHPITGDLRYVGQTQVPLKRRLSLHLWQARNKKSPRHVLSWICSLLAVGLEPCIRSIATASLIEDLNRLEIEIISKARAAGHHLTNHCAGGLGTPGRKLSVDHNSRLHSAEAIARMAHTRKGQPSPRKGVRLSSTTRAKVSVSKLGNQCRYRADAPTQEMIRLRAEGKTLKAIGDLLGVSRVTVRNRLQREAR